VRRALCFGLALALCLASLSAQSSSPLPISNPPSALPQTGLSLVQDCQTLIARLEERKSQAEEQVKSWQNTVNLLKQEIEHGKQESKELSDKLAKAEAALKQSQADLKETLLLLDQSQIELVNLKQSHAAEVRSLNTELWIWRIAAALGVGFGIWASLR
jgi:predicted RNase H-like nuclease (RuvC/YqgF family)